MEADAEAGAEADTVEAALKPTASTGPRLSTEKDCGYHLPFNI